MNLKNGDILEDIFLISKKNILKTKTNSYYLTLALVNRKYGELEGKIWENAENAEKLFNENDLLKINGEVNFYQSKFQLNIKKFEKTDAKTVDLSIFLPVSKQDNAKMVKDLKNYLRTISDPFLKRLLNDFLEDETILDKFRKSPAAKEMHHVYIGGLLEHTLSVIKLADTVACLYPVLNRDHLIAGAFLHDIGKIKEISCDGKIEYTKIGRLIGHITLAVEMLNEKIGKIANFPEELKILLTHLILSHHGQYEFGSPKRPKTAEALVLNYIDEMDAKLNNVLVTINETSEAEGSFTKYNRMLERFLFKEVTLNQIKLLEEKNSPEPKPLENPSLFND